MAKGRRFMASRSERFLGDYSYSYSQTHGTAADLTEFGEEDVWSMVDDMADGNGHGMMNGWEPRAASRINGFGDVQGRIHEEERRHVGGLSLAFDGSGYTTPPMVVSQFRGQETSRGRRQHVATSAPVNVPDWSKIYRVDSVESLHESDDGDDDDHGSELVPPHEYLGRKTAANSVFVGAGRTLKGRDLSRVRDAVWSQTGFDG